MGQVSCGLCRICDAGLCKRLRLLFSLTQMAVQVAGTMVITGATACRAANGYRAGPAVSVLACFARGHGVFTGDIILPRLTSSFIPAPLAGIGISPFWGSAYSGNDVPRVGGFWPLSKGWLSRMFHNFCALATSLGLLWHRLLARLTLRRFHNSSALGRYFCGDRPY